MSDLVRKDVEKLPEPFKPNSQNLTSKPLNGKQQRLARLIIENRPDKIWSDIAEMSGYSVRHVHELRTLDEFNAYLNELLDSTGLKTQVRVDARGARDYLVRRKKLWPAVKDALDRTEGVPAQKLEVKGGIVIPIIVSNLEDLRRPPIREDLKKKLRDDGRAELQD